MKTAQGTRFGRIVARDLMTTDLEASKLFYTKLCGFSAEDLELGGLGTWSVLRSGGTTVARLVPFDADLGFPSHWVGYVSVESVERACERAAEVGGACAYPAFEDPSFGTFGMVDDGAKGLTKPFLSLRGDPPFDAAPGRLIWDVLFTDGAAAAARFYGGVYGWRLWESDGARIFELDGEGVASLVSAIPGVAANAWVPCVRSEPLEEAVDRARELGAKLLHGPIELRHVGRAAFVVDPTGAKIGLLAPVPSRRSPRKPPSLSKRETTPARSSTRAPVVASGPRPTPRELFSRIGERVVTQAASGLSAVIQYELSGEQGGSWHIVFDRGSCDVREGVHDSPTLSLTMTADDYVDLALGKLTGVQAVATGRIELVGDMTLAMKLGRLLKPLA
jgi:predicted enzyme related to lactoylglutathione lyase/putative sterol carrier protein